MTGHPPPKKIPNKKNTVHLRRYDTGRRLGKEFCVTFFGWFFLQHEILHRRAGEVGYEQAEHTRPIGRVENGVEVPNMCCF